MGVTTEPPWLNKSKGVAPANGTSTHVITFSTDGDEPFTPATDSLLVVIIYGAVTHAASGWTEQLSPVSSGELSVFTKTSAPDTSITVTHNASNYIAPWIAFELPAGSVWTNGASSNQGDDTWSALSGLPGTEQLIVAARGRVNDSAAATSADTPWAEPWVEDADLFTVHAGGNDHGYLTVAHQINVTSTSITPVQATTYGGTWVVGDRQNIVFAINAVAPSGTTPFTKDVTESYRVFNSITKDLIERYRVTNAWTVDRADVYRVFNALTVDKVERYRVYAAFAKDVADTWRVFSGITKDLLDIYRVFNSFARDVTDTWTILSATGFVKDVADSWRVYAVFTKDAVERYRILSDTPTPPLPADAVAYLEENAVAVMAVERATAYL